MRFLKFNAVGAAGVAVQLGVLALLVHVAGLHYLLATFLAVETAVLHNFFWHIKWTWADRPGNVLATLLRFHLSNGAVSLLGNLVFMRLLAGAAGLEPVLANLVSIALCGLLNFVLSDRFVFTPKS